jgi:2-polyprenyl-3-methyl-5-hydroxy-6-metoxy-1,4-benzoquinol methylase
MSGERLEYDSLNRPVFDLIPTTARRVLDVGCGVGTLGRAVKARQPSEVVGLTFSSAEAERAGGALDQVVVQDLEAFDPTGLGTFDCVVCSHVLEHLRHPERVLAAVRPLLTSGGCLVVALPNVLVWRQRVRFALGRFRYTDGGLMDRTHFRFFDWKSAQEVVTAAGYTVRSAKADGGFPGSRFLPGVGKLIDRGALKLFPGLFGWQVILSAVPDGGTR